MEAPATIRTVAHYIDGRLDHAQTGRFGEVFDPASGCVQSRVPLADEATVDTAVRAAAGAFSAWSRTPLGKRAEVLFAFRALLKDNAAQLAQIVSAEHGKIVSDAAGEVTRALEVVDFACSLPHQLKGQYSENVSTAVDTYSIRQSVGVCAGITPFNFPMMVPAWMFAIALACGNTFLLKPSERDPSASVLVAQLLERAGLPPGVFNVVHGDKAAVDALLAHPLVNAVSFVGSTPIAKYVYAAAAANGKRVQALGGAKNHMVVMPDADMDAAADALVSAAYGSAGQRCMAISASVCVGSAAEPLLERVKSRVRALKIGPGHDASNDMGPVISGAARERIVKYIEQGQREGATLVLDGRSLRVAGHESGFFVGPTLFDGVDAGMSIYRDEIFGPVLVNVRVDTLEAALAVLRANPYGNGASIFTRSGAAARRFQSEVDAGMVGINVPIPVPVGYYRLRRLEGVALRRFARLRRGRIPVLHARKSDNCALARCRRGNQLRLPHVILGESIHRTLSDVEVRLEANRCLNCYDAPCMNACPTHIDVASFIRKITTGNVKGSARVIMDANPMGASCARVCPTEQLCEGACVYNAAGDSPIRIGDLQRYAVDSVMRDAATLFEAGAETGKCVAIVGGGPAGLSAARDLRRMGHAVTIFEAHDALGGLNTYGIVPFRLDLETALWEAAQVAAMGVTVRTSTRVGEDVRIEDLTRDYDAVILACGMGSVPRLNVPGEDLQGVWDALDFIERAKLGEDVGPLGQRVAVIGAGNTAIDALTCSKRIAPSARVTCYYRRGQEQMTAYEFEYAFAKQEGVEFRFFCMPTRIIAQNGRASAVEFVRTVLREGRAVPEMISGSEFVEAADTVIRAVGQSRLLGIFDGLRIAHDDGVVRVDAQLQTTRPGIFAAGDCIFEKGMREAMVVEAAEQGKRAARSVDAYVSSVERAR